MKTFRSSIRFWLLVAFTACLPFYAACDFVAGVGDAAKAKFDRELAGYWVQESNGKVDVIWAKPNKDGKTYDFEWIHCEGTLAEPTKLVLTPITGQAWLTDIGGTRFLTAKFEKVADVVAAQAKESPYVICKVTRSGDELTLTRLNRKTEDFQQAKTTDEMEIAVKKHLDDESAYEGTHQLKRSTAEAVRKARSLVEKAK